MGITFTDIFCGAGGASTGLVNAGWELKLAANHWQTAIDTHSANHPQAEHVCADVSNYDMRRLPRTDVLWASPICTEISRRGRRRSKKISGLTEEELRSLPDAAFERTRATAYDVIRAVEVHRYKAVLIENVTEFATDWILFDWWLSGMVKLGYSYQIVCVSSAHIGDELNPAAPSGGTASTSSSPGSACASRTSPHGPWPGARSATRTCTRGRAGGRATQRPGSASTASSTTTPAPITTPP